MILGAILGAKTAYQRRGLPIMDDFQYLAMRIPRMGEREYALPTRNYFISGLVLCYHPCNRQWKILSCQVSPVMLMDELSGHKRVMRLERRSYSLFVIPLNTRGRVSSLVLIVP